MEILSGLGLVLAGIVIGWYLPQPVFMKELVEKFKADLLELRNKKAQVKAVEAVKVAGEAMVDAGDKKITTTIPPKE